MPPVQPDPQTAQSDQAQNLAAVPSGPEVAQQDPSQMPGPDISNEPQAEMQLDNPNRDQGSPLAEDDLDAELDGLLDLDDVQ